MRPRRPSRDLRLLPGGKLFIQIGKRLLRLLFEALDLVSNRDIAACLHGAQFLDLLLELADWLFEVEVGAHRASNMGTQSRNCRGAAKLAAAAGQVKERGVFRFPPADADRGPGFSAALRARAYKSGWSRYRHAPATFAPSAGPRRSAADGSQRRGAARAD